MRVDCIFNFSLEKILILIIQSFFFQEGDHPNKVNTTNVYTIPLLIRTRFYTQSWKKTI